MPILLHVGNAPSVKRPSSFENVWPEMQDFPTPCEKSWLDQFHISGFPSYVLAKNLNILKFKLKD